MTIRTPRYYNEKPLRGKANKRVHQHINYITIEEERFSRIATRLDALENRASSPPPSPKQLPSKQPVRQPAIPTLNMVEWNQFKELTNMTESHHAVDVLVGEPVLSHHRQKDTVLPS